MREGKPAWWPSGVPWDEDEPWEARVEQIGRWQWFVQLHRGMTSNQGSIVFGSRARAEAVARRILARQQRRDARAADVTVIR